MVCCVLFPPCSISNCVSRRSFPDWIYFPTSLDAKSAISVGNMRFRKELRYESTVRDRWSLRASTDTMLHQLDEFYGLETCIHACEKNPARPCCDLRPNRQVAEVDRRRSNCRARDGCLPQRQRNSVAPRRGSGRKVADSRAVCRLAAEIARERRRAGG